MIQPSPSLQSDVAVDKTLSVSMRGGAGMPNNAVRRQPLFSTRAGRYVPSLPAYNPKFYSILAHGSESEALAFNFAAKLRTDFPQECDRVSALNKLNLEEFFDQVDIIVIGVSHLLSVLEKLYWENSQYDERLSVFANQWIASNSERYRIFVRANVINWDSTEISIHGRIFLDDVHKYLLRAKNSWLRIDYSAEDPKSQPTDSVDDGYSQDGPVVCDAQFTETTIPLSPAVEAAAPAAPADVDQKRGVHASKRSVSCPPEPRNASGEVLPEISDSFHSHSGLDWASLVEKEDDVAPQSPSSANQTNINAPLEAQAPKGCTAFDAQSVSFDKQQETSGLARDTGSVNKVSQVEKKAATFQELAKNYLDRNAQTNGLQTPPPEAELETETSDSKQSKSKPLTEVQFASTRNISSPPISRNPSECLSTILVEDSSILAASIRGEHRVSPHHSPRQSAKPGSSNESLSSLIEQDPSIVAAGFDGESRYSPDIEGLSTLGTIVPISQSRIQIDRSRPISFSSARPEGYSTGYTMASRFPPLSAPSHSYFLQGQDSYSGASKSPSPSVQPTTQTVSPAFQPPWVPSSQLGYYPQPQQLGPGPMQPIHPAGKPAGQFPYISQGSHVTPYSGNTFIPTEQNSQQIPRGKMHPPKTFTDDARVMVSLENYPNEDRMHRDVSGNSAYYSVPSRNSSSQTVGPPKVQAYPGHNNGQYVGYAVENPRNPGQFGPQASQCSPELSSAHPKLAIQHATDSMLQPIMNKSAVGYEADESQIASFRRPPTKELYIPKRGNQHSKRSQSRVARDASLKSERPYKQGYSQSSHNNSMEKPVDLKKLHVTGPYLSEQMLSLLINPFGPSCIGPIIGPKQYAVWKWPYCFVEFPSTGLAEKAQKALHGRQLDNDSPPLKVKYAFVKDLPWQNCPPSAGIPSRHSIDEELKAFAAEFQPPSFNGTITADIEDGSDPKGIEKTDEKSEVSESSEQMKATDTRRVGKKPTNPSKQEISMRSKEQPPSSPVTELIQVKQPVKAATYMKQPGSKREKSEPSQKPLTSLTRSESKTTKSEKPQMKDLDKEASSTPSSTAMFRPAPSQANKLQAALPLNDKVVSATAEPEQLSAVSMNDSSKLENTSATDFGKVKEINKVHTITTEKKDSEGKDTLLIVESSESKTGNTQKEQKRDALKTIQTPTKLSQATGLGKSTALDDKPSTMETVTTRVVSEPVVNIKKKAPSAKSSKTVKEKSKGKFSTTETPHFKPIEATKTEVGPSIRPIVKAAESKETSTEVLSSGVISESMATPFRAKGEEPILPPSHDGKAEMKQQRDDDAAIDEPLKHDALTKPVPGFVETKDLIKKKEAQDDDDIVMTPASDKTLFGNQELKFAAPTLKPADEPSSTPDAPKSAQKSSKGKKGKGKKKVASAREAPAEPTPDELAKWIEGGSPTSKPKEAKQPKSEKGSVTNSTSSLRLPEMETQPKEVEGSKVKKASPTSKVHDDWYHIRDNVSNIQEAPKSAKGQATPKVSSEQAPDDLPIAPVRLTHIDSSDAALLHSYHKEMNYDSQAEKGVEKVKKIKDNVIHLRVASTSSDESNTEDRDVDSFNSLAMGLGIAVSDRKREKKSRGKKFQKQDLAKLLSTEPETPAKTTPAPWAKSDSSPDDPTQAILTPSSSSPDDSTKQGRISPTSVLRITAPTENNKDSKDKHSPNSSNVTSPSDIYSPTPTLKGDSSSSESKKSEKDKASAKSASKTDLPPLQAKKIGTVNTSPKAAEKSGRTSPQDKTTGTGNKAPEPITRTASPTPAEAKGIPGSSKHTPKSSVDLSKPTSPTSPLDRKKGKRPVSNEASPTNSRPTSPQDLSITRSDLSNWEASVSISVKPKGATQKAHKSRRKNSGTSSPSESEDKEGDAKDSKTQEATEERPRSVSGPSTEPAKVKQGKSFADIIKSGAPNEVISMRGGGAWALPKGQSVWGGGRGM